jgi:outer membrane protein assembly factor BamA
MSIRVSWAILLSFFLALAVCAGEPVAIVREIRISGNTRTQTEVILREVLFQPGEPLMSDLVDETLRNLRALLFLGDVSLDAKKDGAFVDVLIRVTDLYARAITPLLAGKVGELSYGAVGQDYNFLGRGQIVELTAEHDAITGNRVRAFFRESRFADSRIRVDLDVEAAAEGHRVFLSATRPFFRLSETVSVGASGFSQESIQRLYSGQTLSEKYAELERGGSFSVQRSYGGRVKVRPGLFLSVVDLTSSPEAGFAYSPSDRRRVLTSAGLTVWRPRYETTRFFRRLGRTEDLQTGSWATVRAVGSDRDYRFLTVDINPRLKPSERTYILTRITYRGRFSEGSTWNVFASADATILVKIREIHALAARVRWDGLGRMEDTTQYLLGSGRGLRGYSLRRFDGARRLFFNLEGRPTLVRKKAFTVAGVVFVDGGTAWSPGIGGKSLAMAAGIGGRVGMNRVYNSPVLRADLGYGFKDRTWVLYMGIGQYF